jgi:hypothetical protein
MLGVSGVYMGGSPEHIRELHSTPVLHPLNTAISHALEESSVALIDILHSFLPQRRTRVSLHYTLLGNDGASHYYIRKSKC